MNSRGSAVSARMPRQGRRCEGGGEGEGEESRSLTLRKDQLPLLSATSNGPANVSRHGGLASVELVMVFNIPLIQIHGKGERGRQSGGHEAGRSAVAHLLLNRRPGNSLASVIWMSRNAFPKRWASALLDSLGGYG